MSSALHLKLSISKRLAVFIGLTHFLALAIVPSLALPAWVLLILLLAVFVSLAHGLAKVWQIYPTSITELLLESDGQWTLTEKSRRRVQLELSSQYLHPQFAALCFKFGAWRKRCVLVLSDAVGADEYYRLRRRLMEDRSD